jgi:hypothetical protein
MPNVGVTKADSSDIAPYMYAIPSRDLYVC